MAKKMRKILTTVLTLCLIVSIMAIPVNAAFTGKKPSQPKYPWYPDGNQQYEQKEWYEVYLQGNKIAEGSGKPNDVFYLGTHYETDVDIQGDTLTWYILPLGIDNPQEITGYVDLSTYAHLDIPEGYVISEYKIEGFSVDGVNDPVYNMYDNAIITIAITKIINPETGEEIELPPVDPIVPTDPVDPEPDPVDPEPDPVDPEPDPVDPEPDPVDPEPDPVDPEPDPVDPEPDPVDPEPDPVDPEPDPVDPEPDPVDPEPDPVDPDPDPVDPDPQSDEGEIVPKADVPKTGDASLLWAAVSSLSAGGLALVNRKRKQEE